MPGSSAPRPESSPRVTRPAGSSASSTANAMSIVRRSPPLASQSSGTRKAPHRACPTRSRAVHGVVVPAPMGALASSAGNVNDCASPVPGAPLHASATRAVLIQRFVT